MGVSNAPKGFDLFLENGWAHDVIASSGWWELRLYPQQVPAMWVITARTSLLRAEASVRQDSVGWRVKGMLDAEPAESVFTDPITAFHWWAKEN
jgi:hypothetical protein